MAAKDPGLTLINLAGGPGLGSIPRLGEVWDHVLKQVARVHEDQDAGILLPDGNVEVTLKITLARKGTHTSKMDVTHSASIKTPGYSRAGCTAHRHGDAWKFIPEDQPDLPGVERIPARNDLS